MEPEHPDMINCKCTLSWQQCRNATNFSQLLKGVSTRRSVGREHLSIGPEHFIWTSGSSTTSTHVLYRAHVKSCIFERQQSHLICQESEFSIRQSDKKSGMIFFALRRAARFGIRVNFLLSTRTQVRGHYSVLRILLLRRLIQYPSILDRQRKPPPLNR